MDRLVTHGKVIVCRSEAEANAAQVRDWWSGSGKAEQAGMIAFSRAEIARLNVAARERMVPDGRLGPDALQVGEREFRVGDRIVCGRNARARLGVVNGTRGQVTALDPDQRALTVTTDDHKTVTLPGWYVAGRGHDDQPWVDLAYAITGHKTQGLTRWRALVRLTGTEDSNWLYVQLSRAQHRPPLYPVVGPEPRRRRTGPARPRAPTATTSSPTRWRAPATSGWRSTPPARLDLRRLPTAELRAERDRLCGLLDQAPRDRARELERASARRIAADQTLEELTGTHDHRARAGDASPAWPAGPVATERARRCWPASRPTAPPTPNTDCASTNSAGPAGWRPTSSSARPTARSSANWPGGAVPAASPWNKRAPLPARRTRPDPRHHQRAASLATSRRRPSRTTAAPTTSPTPSKPSADRRATPASGPPGSKLAKRSIVSKAAITALTTAASRSGARHRAGNQSTATSRTRHQPAPSGPRPGPSGPERAAG